MIAAKTNLGFFYIVNFGLNQQEVDHQFAIGKEFFKLSTEEKLKYRADLEHGGYNGYKPLGLREIVPGKFDVRWLFPLRDIVIDRKCRILRSTTSQNLFQSTNVHTQRSLRRTGPRSKSLVSTSTMILSASYWFSSLLSLSCPSITSWTAIGTRRSLTAICGT